MLKGTIDLTYSRPQKLIRRKMRLEIGKGVHVARSIYQPLDLSCIYRQRQAQQVQIEEDYHVAWSNKLCPITKKDSLALQEPKEFSFGQFVTFSCIEAR